MEGPLTIGKLFSSSNRKINNAIKNTHITINKNKLHNWLNNTTSKKNIFIPLWLLITKHNCQFQCIIINSSETQFVSIVIARRSISTRITGEQDSGAGYSVGPHSEILLLLWLTMRIRIVNFHFNWYGRPTLCRLTSSLSNRIMEAIKFENEHAWTGLKVKVTRFSLIFPLHMRFCHILKCENK